MNADKKAVSHSDFLSVFIGEDLRLVFGGGSL
jgi:hypothetical protein